MGYTTQKTHSMIGLGMSAISDSWYGFAQNNKTVEGYLPLELDHINGDRYDNRLENLRVLCPNCHSLTPTHRGRSGKGKKRNFDKYMPPW